MSLSVIFNHFTLRVLSRQPIWILNLLHTGVYVCMCVFSLLLLHCAAFSLEICACMCVHTPWVRLIPHSPWAGWAKWYCCGIFWPICKSAVTVMRAAQRRRRCGKCQHVSEEWHRTSVGDICLDLALTWQGQTRTNKSNPSSYSEQEIEHAHTCIRRTRKIHQETEREI